MKKEKSNMTKKWAFQHLFQNGLSFFSLSENETTIPGTVFNNYWYCDGHNLDASKGPFHTLQEAVDHSKAFTIAKLTVVGTGNVISVDFINKKRIS